eukprot:11221852-Lingulodinium_polyedra.AAC.1
MSSAVPHRDCITLHTCCDGRQVCINTIVALTERWNMVTAIHCLRMGVLEQEGGAKLMVKNIMTRSVGKA